MLFGNTRKLAAENQAKAFAEVTDNTICLRFRLPQIVNGQAVHQRRDQSRLTLGMFLAA